MFLKNVNIHYQNIYRTLRESLPTFRSSRLILALKFDNNFQMVFETPRFPACKNTLTLQRRLKTEFDLFLLDFSSQSREVADLACPKQTTRDRKIFLTCQ